MKASILMTSPFIIPNGTKIQIKNDVTGKSAVVFFAGYKVLGRELVADHFDLFPTFRAVTKTGTMSVIPPKDWPSYLGTSDMEHCSLTVLELPKNLLLNARTENRFNNKLCDLVAACTAEMFDMARRAGITEIDFNRYPSIDKPWVTFNDDDNHYAWCPVEKLSFNEKDGEIVIRGNDHGTAWDGFLDGSWGDYFDVGHSFGAIYRAFVEALRK